MSLRNHRKEAPIDVAFRNGQLKTLEWVFGKSTWQPAKRDSMAPSKRVPLGGANLGRDFRIRGPLRHKVEDRGIVPPPDLPPGMKTHDLRVWPVLAAKAHIHAHGILTEDEEREQQNAAATKNTGNSDEWDWPEEEEAAAEPVKEREAFDGLRGEHWRMMGPNPNG
jgi:hypothetical protein